MKNKLCALASKIKALYKTQFEVSAKHEFYSQNADGFSGAFDIIFPQENLMFSTVVGEETMSGVNEWYIQTPDFEPIKGLEYDETSFEAAKEAFKQVAGYMLPLEAEQEIKEAIKAYKEAV